MGDTLVCRSLQRDALREHLESPVVGPGTLFVTGPASTGKTSVVKQTLKEVGQRHSHVVSVYLDCVQCCTSKTLYRTLVRKLAQVLYGTDTVSRGKTSQAVTTVSQCMTRLVAMLQDKRMRVWIVLDNVDRVLDHKGLLPVLDRVAEMSGVDVGLILVSRFPWCSGMFSESHTSGSKYMRDPSVTVEFSAYTDEELKKICLARGYSARCQMYATYFEQFLSFIIPAVTRMSNNILDIQAVVTKLWPHYIAPVKKAGRDGVQARNLSARVRPMLKNIVSEMDIGLDRSRGPVSLKDGQSDTLHAKVLFAIPYMGKWILLASYIASRNKPTTDKAVFDPGYSKKRRRNSQALDRQAEQALEMKLRGSHPFPLERMLNIFYYIAEPKTLGVEALPDDYRSVWCQKMQHVDVSMQVSSLCSLGLLTCVGVDPLTAPTFRCNVSEDLAYIIAGNLNVSLNDYLKLA